MRMTIALAFTILLFGCAGPAQDTHPARGLVALDPVALATIRDELIQLEADDQRYEHMVINRDPAIEEPGFFERKDALQVERADRCKEIFRRIGFPGYDLVGEDASHAFWLLVQHADHDPAFQGEVATAMAEAHRAGHAKGSQLAYLTDRVRVNTGRPQLYGTQVDHDIETGRVFPKPLERPAEVDARRASAGLDPLWESMNSHAELYHRMNEQAFLDKGVDEPYRYAEGFSDW